MPRKYTGNSDGAAKGKRPGTEKFVDICEVLYKFKNLGTWVVRDMRGKPGQLSVHATGRAMDLGYDTKKWSRQQLESLCDTLVKYADDLGIEEIHDYSYKGPTGVFGRGWRNSRNAWKVYDAKDNAGTPGGKWLHIEIEPSFADDPKKVKAAWDKVLAAVANG
jgi:hypothetical protein